MEIEADHILTLDRNGTFKTEEDGAITLEGTWHITGDALWDHGLVLTYTFDGLEEPIEQFTQVLLCDEYLILSSAALDGPTDFYYRPDGEPLQSRD